MRILLELRHPAHVHLFKNLYWELIQKGHEVKIIAIDKEVSCNLLDKYNIPYTVVGTNKRGLFNKFIEMLRNDWRVFRITISFKADLFVGRSSPSLAHVGYIKNIKYIAFSDTEHAKLVWKVTKPFITTVLTPSSFLYDLGDNHLRYDGFHELAYLHPNYYSPDQSVLDLLNVNNDEQYVIIRFVSWNASHDVGQKGLDLSEKSILVKELSKYAKIFITSEGKLPAEFKRYQIQIPPDKMHDALAFAALYVGEGATMASECAMLGVPAIYINSLDAGTLQEQSNYGLIHSYRVSNGIIKKAAELLTDPDGVNDLRVRHQRMLSEKIDVTAFMVWFVENYPNSVEIMKKNPTHQNQFLLC